VSEPGAVAMGS